MWQFDESRHLLRRGNRERRLEPKAVAVLARLVRADGAVVSKEELLEAAWADRYVTEEVLTNAIYQLRKALEDDARDPTYIETIPKRGYRLIRPLETGATPRRPPARSRTGRPWIAAALVTLAVGLVARAPADRALRSVAADPRSADLVTRGWEALDSAGSSSAEEATVLAEEALRLAPESADAWALAATAATFRAARGATPDARRSHRQALAAADRALANSPHHPRALAARARARWLGAWDWEGAESDLAAALARSPESPALWTDWAELLFFSGRIDEAQRAADRALELEADSPRVRMTAALLASFAGDRDEAAAHYRAVLELDAEHSAARL